MGMETRLKELQKEVEVMDLMLAEKSKKNKELEAKVEELESNLAKNREGLRQADRYASECRVAFKKTLEATKQELEAIRFARKKGGEYTFKLQRKLREVKAETAQLREALERIALGTPVAVDEFKGHYSTFSGIIKNNAQSFSMYAVDALSFITLNTQAYSDRVEKLERFVKSIRIIGNYNTMPEPIKFDIGEVFEDDLGETLAELEEKE